MAADERVEAVRAVELGAKVADLALEDALGRGLAHQGQHVVHVEGLGDVIVGPALDRLHRGAHILDGGDDDHGHGIVEGQDLGEEGGTGRARHADIEEDDVDAA